MKTILLAIALALSATTADAGCLDINGVNKCLSGPRANCAETTRRTATDGGDEQIFGAE